jgi:integrase
MARDAKAKMKAGVRRRGERGKWSYTIDLGLQSAQRCQVCGKRVWLTGERLERCPKCGGALCDTEERRQVTQGGFTTHAEAVAARNKQSIAVREGIFVEPSALTLGAYLSGWLLRIRGEDLKLTSLTSYTSLLSLHVIAYPLGATRLQKLTREAIRGHYAELAVSGKFNGAGLGPASVQRVHAALHRALADAVESGLLLANPANGAAKRLPKPARRGALNVWTAQELAAFLASAAGEPTFALWRVLAWTGMRRGEACALRWGDVNLADGCVAITKNRVPVRKTLTASGIVESSTKSDRCRMVELDAETVKVLRHHATTQTANLAERWLFTDAAGEPLHPNFVSAEFLRLSRAAMLPRRTVHSLRHTHATLLLESGVPVHVVAERLGHASATMTLDVYAHAIRAGARDHIQRVADELSRTL